MGTRRTVYVFPFSCTNLVSLLQNTRAEREQYFSNESSSSKCNFAPFDSFIFMPLYSGQSAALSGGTTTHIDFISPTDAGGEDLLGAWEEYQRKGESAVMDYGLHIILRAPKFTDKVNLVNPAYFLFLLASSGASTGILVLPLSLNAAMPGVACITCMVVCVRGFSCTLGQWMGLIEWDAMCG